jgi:hypothetical protein
MNWKPWWLSRVKTDDNDSEVAGRSVLREQRGLGNDMTAHWLHG